KFHLMDLSIVSLFQSSYSNPSVNAFENLDRYCSDGSGWWQSQRTNFFSRFPLALFLVILVVILTKRRVVECPE
ncbi:MAG TPA: hypothetical protein VF884_04775, partial [Nitrososphaeraceae archaeon]